MDHTCEKCGTHVPDGRPFCPQCRAPQVRVEIAIPAPEQNPTVGTPSVSQTATLESTHAVIPGDRIARSAVVKAGILGVLLGFIPLLGSVLTGVLAVWFYRRAGATPGSARPGARLGGAAAALAFAISASFTVVQVFVFHAQKESEEAMLKFLGNIGANLADPELQASLHRLFTPSGMAFSILLGLIVSAVLGAVGGAIAASSRPRPRP